MVTGGKKKTCKELQTENWKAGLNGSEDARERQEQGDFVRGTSKAGTNGCLT